MRLTVALIISATRVLYSWYTVSRSASRTFWKMTCLANCAAMRPSPSVDFGDKNLAADFSFGIDLLRRLHRDLVDGIFDRARTSRPRFHRVGADGPRVLVQFGAEILLVL